MEPMKITANNSYTATIRTRVTRSGSRVQMDVGGLGGAKRARLYLCERQVHDLMVWLGAAQAELDLAKSEAA